MICIMLFLLYCMHCKRVKGIPDPFLVIGGGINPQFREKKETNPEDISKLPNKQSKNLCFTLVNSVPRLKRTHKYYCQVQLQIIICEVSFCDFVIWSPKGMSVERIMKDEEFVQSVLPRLQRSTGTVYCQNTLR